MPLNSDDKEGVQEKSQAPSFRYQSIFSSHVAEVAYDRGSKKLRVRFTDGSEYEYHNVQSGEYSELMQAESTGRFMAGFKGRHKGRRV